ncbi:hypothetical protein PGT21_025752 [Puccinia graminis f. sp. tritici]|uniref:Uncharacterized protein n=1 Tax=Puccinia graminis f. sp. tritici TaxID=56615 RepID=A0A5B0MK05_PUCGR|nr:hypothetical protein PGT21_025752 [Puccinia graminis f. sp. tritici]
MAACGSLETPSIPSKIKKREDGGTFFKAVKSFFKECVPVHNVHRSPDTTTSQSLETKSPHSLMETRPSQNLEKISTDSVEIGPSKSLELDPSTFLGDKITAAHTNEEKDSLKKLFTILDDALPHWHSLDNQLQSDIFKTWKRIPERFDSFKYDSLCLSYLEKDILEKLQEVKMGLEGEDLRICTDLITNFKNLNKKLSKMIQLRFLELMESYPKIKLMESLLSEAEFNKKKASLQRASHELLEDNLNQEFQQIGHSVLEELCNMKNQFKALKLLPQSPRDLSISPEFEPFREYFYTAIDLLYKHGSINEDTVQRYFNLNDKESLEQLSSYIDFNIWLRKGYRITGWKTGITECWYLPVFNTSLKALSLKQELIINFYVLAKSLICEGNKIFINEKPDHEWKIFLK